MARNRNAESMKRVMGIVNSYVASKKPVLKNKSNKHIETTYSSKDYDQYFKRRQFMSEQKITFFPVS